MLPATAALAAATGKVLIAEGEKTQSYVDYIGSEETMKLGRDHEDCDQRRQYHAGAAEARH